MSVVIQSIPFLVTTISLLWYTLLHCYAASWIIRLIGDKESIMVNILVIQVGLGGWFLVKKPKLPVSLRVNLSQATLAPSLEKPDQKLISSAVFSPRKHTVDICANGELKAEIYPDLSCHIVRNSDA